MSEDLRRAFNFNGTDIYKDSKKARSASMSDQPSRETSKKLFILDVSSWGGGVGGGASSKNVGSASLATWVVRGERRLGREAR